MKISVENSKTDELVDRALSAMQVGDVDSAVALFEEVVALNESDWRYSNELGNCLMQAKRYEKARGAFDQCLKVAPEQQKSFVMFNKALTYTFEGKLDDALSLHLTILKSEPDNIKSNGEAAILMRKLGRYGEASVHAENTINLLKSQQRQVSYLGDDIPNDPVNDQLSLAYLSKARIHFAVKNEEDAGLKAIEMLLDETASIDRALIMANELMKANKPGPAHSIAIQIIKCYGDEEVDADILELYENSKAAISH